MTDRHLDWDGCWNARDLGGLRMRDGGTTRWRSVVRSDGVGRLSDAGWQALWDYGVRTVVDLRNDDERHPDFAARPAGLTTVHVPLDDAGDAEFWDHVREHELDGSPLYFRPFLDRKTEQCVAAMQAIADADPDGGVVFHCAAGRDRTGLVTLLLLSLADVVPDELVADYEASTERLRPAWPALGLEDQGDLVQAVLETKGTTAREALLAVIDGFDAAGYLEAAGLAAASIDRLRRRLR